jgi:hypothetical protein
MIFKIDGINVYGSGLESEPLVIPSHISDQSGNAPAYLISFKVKRPSILDEMMQINKRGVVDFEINAQHYTAHFLREDGQNYTFSTH